MSQNISREGIKYLLVPFKWTLLMAITFFLAAGRLDVLRAWLAFGIHFIGAVAGAMLMWKYAPGLANRRSSAGEGTRSWDKLVLIVYLVLVLVVTPIAAGFDVARYRWSQLGMYCCVAGIVFYAVFFLLFYWAMLTNEHFEGTARIQNDRGHRVITNGPYRLVRHPGYVAMILAGLADPFIIGSFYALMPAALAMGVTIIRTSLEDRMLCNELAGYAEYAQTTRYRLLPGIW